MATSNNNNNNKGKIAGIIAGLVGVTVVGLLFEPKNGKKRRDALKKQTTNVNNKIKEKTVGAKSTIEEYLEERKRKNIIIRQALEQDRENMIFDDFDM